MKILILILTSISLFCGSSTAHSENSVRSFGHNLTATANVPRDKACALGFQVVACGWQEYLGIGSSPFLWSYYSMDNAYVRYRWLASEDTAYALQIAHFKTRTSATRYDMESTWLYAIKTSSLAPHYTLHWNIQYAYFFNDRKPFSLRRPDVKREPWQVNITTLHELKMVNGYYLMGELGILGLNYHYPQVHSGASLQYRSNSWLIQFGYTVSGTLQALFSPTRRMDYQFFLYDLNEDYDLPVSHSLSRYDYSIHPEVVIQYYF